MKVKEKIPSGSIKIEIATYQKVADYCKKNGLKISFFTTEALNQKLVKVNTSTDG